MLWRLGLILCLLAPVAARAQEPDEDEVVHPGVMTRPPGPAPRGDGVPTVVTDPGGRRAVRGRPVTQPPEPADLREMREWEVAAFPAGGRLPSEEPAAGRSRPGARAVARADDLPPELRSPSRETERPAAGEAVATEDARPDLPWLKALRTGDLPVRWDPRVIKYLEFYRDDPRGRAIMSGWLAAQGRFQARILEALRRHGLPEDLLYVAMIESGYDPFVYSRAGASGLWQFMPAGGRIYGLTIDHWVDERNDPEKSTEAVMLYWKDLYDRFGNWHLALAAFNAGYGAVLKAIAKYNTNDFWALLELEDALPWGSSIYVPKAIAAAIVGRNREAFGYAEVKPEPAWEFDRVTVPKSVSLAVVSKAAGADEATIQWLNPELRRRRTPPVAGYAVRIPKGTAERFARTFPQLKGEWDGYDAYVVRWGERFEDIARTHGISVAKLKELNGVEDIAEVRGGVVIVVPRVDADTRARNRRAAEDDLYRSDVAPGEPGDPMIVPVPNKDLLVPGRKRVFYRVVAGDTVEDVARVLRVKVADLTAWNRLDLEADLQPRMVLVAFVPPDYDADAAGVALLDDSRLMVVTAGSQEHLDLVEGRKGRKRVKYTVKRGDTLESIGKPHHLSKYDMARINRISPNADLEPGTELIVYVVVDKQRAKQTGVYKKPRKVPPRTVQRPAKKPTTTTTPSRR